MVLSVSRTRRLGVMGVLLSVSLASPAAASDAADVERARQLYAEGITLEAAGDWASALAQFNQVAQLRLTPQVRFHIARCLEQLGRLNEALGAYRLAEFEAQSAGPGGSEVLGQARAAREQLEPRVPKLVIERGEGADAIKIELDGVRVGQAQIGKPVNVDPGPHVVVGVLNDGRRFQRKVLLKEGQTEQLILDVPIDLQPRSANERPTAEASPGESVQVERAAGRPPESETTAIAWVAGGFGLVSLGISAWAFTQRNQAQSDLDAACVARICPESVRERQDAGDRYGTMSAVTLGVGVAALATSIVLFATGGQSSEPTRRAARVDLNVTSRGWEAGLVGAF